MPDKTFIKITNKNIFDKLLEIEDHVKRTNGKVKLNRWISTTAITLATLALTSILVVATKLM